VKIKISSDSTCDLSQELVDKYDVNIVPLYIVKDGKDLVDGVDIVPQDIYDHVANGGTIVSTAAVSVADYLTVFGKLREEYDAVVHFCISSEMSCCYQNACVAAAEIGGVYPVDSRNLSTGIGLLILEAAEMAAKGEMTGEEIRSAIDERREKLDVSFILDTLSYLAKGGRCSTVAALGANLLSLKPCIEVKNGAMGVGKKYRGNLVKCLLQYVKDRLDGRDDIDTRRIFITESGGYTDEEVEQVRQTVLACQPFAEVLHTNAGCTVSSHCGPKTLGILYFHK
jgi:DegV family protein with EDD domain